MSKKNGKYHTKYSYHPYYDLYSKKMFPNTSKAKKEVKKSNVKKEKFSLKGSTRYPTGDAIY